MGSLWRLLCAEPGVRWRMLVVVVAICGLSIATQLEVCALGFLSDQSIDLFKLFRAGPEGLSWEQLQEQWTAIAPSGVLTRADALQQMTAQQDGNPLKALIHTVREALALDVSFEMLLGVLILLACFKAVMQFLSRYVTQLLSIYTSASLRKLAFGRLLRQPMQRTQEQMVGGMSSHVMNDVTSVAASWPALMHNFVQAPVVVIMSFAMCWRLSWQLSLLVFAGCPIVLGPIIWLAQHLKRTQRALLKGQEGFLGSLVDWLNGLSTIRVFNLEEYAASHYQAQNEKLIDLERRGALYAQLGRPILHVVATCLVAGVGLYGLWGLGLSFGTLVVFCGMLYLLYEPIKRYAEENHLVQRARVAAERLALLAQRPEEEAESARIKKAVEPLQRGVEIKEVSFAYLPDRPVLRHCSLTIPRGKMVALVGATGSGKSSLVSLLLGLFSPQSGAILWDGEELGDLDPASVRRQIGVVPQRPFIFQASVRENLTFGQDVAEEEIERVAHAAHALEFIRELPHGWETVLGEGGKSLSGGQLQRLAIARALLKKSSLLILDEATSALDSVSEGLIRQTLQGLKGEKTLLVIAHRLSTITEADWIVVLQEGQVIAQGTLLNLLEQSPAFKAMWEAGQLRMSAEKQAVSRT